MFCVFYCSVNYNFVVVCILSFIARLRVVSIEGYLNIGYCRYRILIILTL